MPRTLTMDDLGRLNKAAFSLVRKLADAGDTRLAMRVSVLNLKIVINQLHRMNVDKRTKKLEKQWDDIYIDLQVKDLELDLQKL